MVARTSGQEDRRKRFVQLTATAADRLRDYLTRMM
jgi:DNA-binding MarR family transcriptional regulator